VSFELVEIFDDMAGRPHYVNGLRRSHTC